MIEVDFYADPDTPEALEAWRYQMVRNHKSSTDKGVQMYPKYRRSIDDPRHRWGIQRMAEMRVLDTPPVALFED